MTLKWYKDFVHLFLNFLADCSSTPYSTPAVNSSIPGRLVLITSSEAEQKRFLLVSQAMFACCHLKDIFVIVAQVESIHFFYKKTIKMLLKRPIATRIHSKCKIPQTHYISRHSVLFYNWSRKGDYFSSERKGINRNSSKIVKTCLTNKLRCLSNLFIRFLVH